jgi:TATA-box binding protein (TBP) (component of TFIID and TFIIIB)
MAEHVLDMQLAGAQAFLKAWAEDVESFVTCMKACLERKGLLGLLATLPDLSTMTVIVQTDCKIDISKLEEVSILDDGVPGASSLGRVSLLVSETRRSRFSNQVSFRYVPNAVEPSKTNCKAFRNGKFHLTGVRSAAEALETLDVVLRMIRALRPGCIKIDRGVAVQSAKVQMLNTDFRLNSPVNLEVLRDTVMSKYGAYSRYESDHFPGCNIKFASATILAFKSGCVIITGAKRMVDIARAYMFIVGAVTECPSVLNNTGKTSAWEEKNCKKETMRGKKRPFEHLLADGVEDSASEELPAFEVVTR